MVIRVLQLVGKKICHTRAKCSYGSKLTQVVLRQTKRYTSPQKATFSNTGHHRKISLAVIENLHVCFYLYFCAFSQHGSPCKDYFWITSHIFITEKKNNIIMILHQLYSRKFLQDISDDFPRKALNDPVPASVSCGV